MTSLPDALKPFSAVCRRWRLSAVQRDQLVRAVHLVFHRIRPALLLDGFAFDSNEIVTDLACLPSPLFLLTEASTQYARHPAAISSYLYEFGH